MMTSALIGVSFWAALTLYMVWAVSRSTIKK